MFLFNHNKTLIVLFQHMSRLSAVTSVATDDDMVFNFFYCVVHSVAFKKMLKLSIYNITCYQRNGISKNTKTGHDEKRCEYFSCIAERVHFAKTNCGNGNDSHVKGIYQRVMLNKNISAHAYKRNNEE